MGLEVQDVAGEILKGSRSLLNLLAAENRDFLVILGVVLVLRLPLFGRFFILGKTSRVAAQNLSCRERTDEFPLQDQWDLYVDQSGMTDVYAGAILLESDTQSLLIGALTAPFPLGICVDGTTKAREVASLSEMSPFPVDKDDSETRSEGERFLKLLLELLGQEIADVAHPRVAFLYWAGVLCTALRKTL